MPTYQPEFHADLPRALFFYRNGRERDKVQSAHGLRPDELDHLKAIRDRMLSLYFPPSVIGSWGKAEAERGWLGTSTCDVGTDGEPVGTRTYRPGHRREFEVPAKGGGTRMAYESIPYVWVPDEVRGKTDTIIEDGEERTIEWKVWERSISAWIRHLCGDDSMLAFWDDRRGDDLTCILFDIDCPRDPSEWIDKYMSPWVEAVAAIEADLDVDLGLNWMLSGSKGVWGQLFLDGPISRPDVARLLTGLAIRVVESGDRVRLGRQTAKFLESRGTIDRWFTQDKETRVLYTLDDGNIANRNCRLPWARHHRTHRIAHFVQPDGSLPESQVDHLFGIHRVSAAEVTRVARELSSEWGLDDDGGGIIGSRFAGAPLAQSQATGADDAPVAHEAGRTEPKSTQDESDEDGPTEWGLDDDGGRGSNDDNNDSTEGKGQRLTLPRHPVPNTNGQRFILLDDYLAAGDDGKRTITGSESTDEILPMMNGAAYESLIDDRRLLDVYDWLTARNEPVTEDGVVALLMSRYVGSDRSDRQRRFAAMVRSDIERGRHRTSPTGRRARAMAAAEAAERAGISNDLTVRILQGICTQSSTGRRIGTTSKLIAYVVGILLPGESDSGRIKAAKVRVGQHIQKLVEAGLLIVHRTGHPGVPSLCEVVIPDDREDEVETCAPEPIAAK